MSYTDEFLLDIVNSCASPDFDAERWGDQQFAAKDGWSVTVFYTSGQPDYLSAIIAPDGIEVECWEDDGTPARTRLLTWSGVEVTT